MSKYPKVGKGTEKFCANCGGLFYSIELMDSRKRLCRHQGI